MMKLLMSLKRIPRAHVLGGPIISPFLSPDSNTVHGSTRDSFSMETKSNRRSVVVQMGCIFWDRDRCWSYLLNKRSTIVGHIARTSVIEWH